MKSFTLPKDFLLGSATAATQIDGGDYNNNWYYWALEGKTENNDSPIVADNHYELYKEDISMIKELGHEIYRLSIDWSRIEPKKGLWSQEALSHYRDELEGLIENDIMPLVTLHHFSCPQWFQEEYGWHHEDAVELFLNYVEIVIDAMGDIIKEYCTINEPNVLLNDTYIDGNFPPGIKDNTKLYFKAAKNMIIAHLKAYKLIHSKRRAKGYTCTKVGFAHHMTYLQSTNPITRIGKAIIDHSFHKIFEKGFIEGKLIAPMGSGYPEGKGTFCDFIGVNYYTRHFIKLTGNPATFFSNVEMADNLSEENMSDMGWEIYPEGLYKVIKHVSKYERPIYITENGIADRDDKKRGRYIYSHLLMVKRLIDEGIDLQRYYHWSLMDNFEWMNGYWPRFGLINVDYDTLTRTKRESCKFYSQICKTKSIDDKLIGLYLDGKITTQTPID